MLAEINKLYETGEFRVGYCLAEVHVNENGSVESVRIVRPTDSDERLESLILRTIASWHYKPATACGRPAAVTTSVGIGHCPESRVQDKTQPG